MWTKLQNLMRQMGGNQSEGTFFNDFQLALASLLVHVAAIDDEYHDIEHDMLKAVLRRHFDLNPSIADMLLRAGREKEKAAVDIYSFTRVLTKALDQPGRQEIVEMLWEIAFADGRIHEYESNLVWRASELMGVSREDRLRLRELVRQRMPAENEPE